MTKQQAERFIKAFNPDHTYTKIVGYKHERGLGRFYIKVLSAVDKRKKLCVFFLNNYKEQTAETASDAINDKYRGLREFLDQHDGLEEQVIAKPMRMAA